MIIDDNCFLGHTVFCDIKGFSGQRSNGRGGFIGAHLPLKVLPGEGTGSIARNSADNAMESKILKSSAKPTKFSATPIPTKIENIHDGEQMSGERKGRIIKE